MRDFISRTASVVKKTTVKAKSVHITGKWVSVKKDVKANVVAHYGNMPGLEFEAGRSHALFEGNWPAGRRPQARDVVRNRKSVALVLKAYNRQSPPASLLAEVFCEVDSFHGNAVSGSLLKTEAATWSMQQGLVGQQLLSKLFRLNRKTGTSKNKALM